MESFLKFLPNISIWADARMRVPKVSQMDQKQILTITIGDLLNIMSKYVYFKKNEISDLEFKGILKKKVVSLVKAGLKNNEFVDNLYVCINIMCYTINIFAWLLCYIHLS